jgi:hypothetical protein
LIRHAINREGWMILHFPRKRCDWYDAKVCFKALLLRTFRSQRSPAGPGRGRASQAKKRLGWSLGCQIDFRHRLNGRDPSARTTTDGTRLIRTSCTFP